MATIELYLTGDEIGTFGSVSVSGKSNGTKVKLNDVETLGSATDVFRVVIEGVEPGQTAFTDGQSISIYGYPDTDPPSEPIYSTQNPNHTEFNGRASSHEHQIILDGSGGGLVIDLDGIAEASLQYGPGINPPLGDQLEFVSLPTVPPLFPCFCKGTLIETPGGPQAIETLKPGDLISTLDNGARVLRWIGHRTVNGMSNMAPITIDAGALDNYRTLRVSPQHRMLLSDWRNDLYFGGAQVLVAAKHLINDKTINQTPVPQVTYFHMVFDAHEVVFAEGIPTESLHLGSIALTALDRAARAEILALFPELETEGPVQTARACLTAREAVLIAQGSNTGVLSPAA